MRDADVCILNQLLFLNGSRGGNSDTFRKSIYFVAYRFCAESLNLSALWPEERFLFLGCGVISSVEWNIQNNRRDAPRDSWLSDCAETGPIRSNISTRSDIDVIYSLDIGQTVLIHVTGPNSIP